MDPMQSMIRRPEKMVDLKDFQSTLYELQSDIDLCKELLAKEERLKTFQSHFQAVFALSNLEVKMTNFAKAVHERFN